MSGTARTHFADQTSFATRWQGGSGREYAAETESLDAFKLDESSIYILVDRDTPGWVGSSRDLIEDQASRARFRLAMRRASNVLRLDGPSDDVDRMVLKHDLEGGRQLVRRNAA